MKAYENVPNLIGALMTSKAATLHELQTVYSIEDAYDLFEVICVDQHNQSMLNKVN